MSQKVFSITTTLPYVNSKPHIGFAFEMVGADILARWHAQNNEKVIFNTGTDEHGQKIYEKALESKKAPQVYCDELVTDFKDLSILMDLQITNFVRTTDPHHQLAAQEMWRRCLAAGDIYKKEYEVKYCVGCEMEKTESELIDGYCPLHPLKELEKRAEENYFFRFSRYGQKLLDLYEQNQNFIQPVGKMKEIKSFIKGGLKDFSISRLASKMPWGVPVPNDDTQVMYVWFDALTNYISTLGWPEKELTEELGWPAIQVCGKDNLRQQTAMWQAMLMSAGLPNSKQILINGFILVNGQKMSKSLGNVISPKELVATFGSEVSRYLLANLGSFNEDVDVGWEKLSEVYHAELTNGLGNLCSRVAKMASQVELGASELGATATENSFFKDEVGLAGELEEFARLLNQNLLSQGLWWLQKKVGEADKYLSETQPWLIKDDLERKKEIIITAVNKILIIATALKIYMPNTAQTILSHFTTDKITSLNPLFPRIQLNATEKTPHD